MTPTLTILLVSGLAAGASGLGVLPLIGRERLPVRWLGLANAAAAGLMLGAAYALSMAGLQGNAWEWTGGAVVGVLLLYLIQRFAGTTDLELNRLDDPGPEYGYKVIVSQGLHSAAEGVTIGVAAVIELSFGIFMAFVFAVHNIAESTVLCSVLRSRNVRLAHSATLAVATASGQVVLAVLIFTLVGLAPATLQAMLGLAMGTLVYLVLVELLPEAYKQAGYLSIALLTSLAMGVIAFLEGVIL